MIKVTNLQEMNHIENAAHSEISKIRKLKSVFDGLKINSRRFSAKIKD